jgi:alpha,alpha-trehalase
MIHAGGSFRILLALLAQGALIFSNVSIRVSANEQALTPTSERFESPDSLQDILEYISASWNTLTRTMSRCNSLDDVKTEGEPVLYLPAETPTPKTLSALQDRCKVRLEHLPVKITGHGEINLNQIKTEGLLYLEHPYVVPGGQFNEMYGWDSYFIIRGLIRHNRLDLAKGMVENFFFEIEHYGGVLNANRTYYLTRSQPPFLTSMIMAVYEAEKKLGKEDIPWLGRAYQYAAHDYEQWTQPPHLAGDTGLSRYFDHGNGPVPEIMGDPSHYYRGAAYFFLAHDGSLESYLVRSGDKNFASAPGPRFPVFVCDPDSTAQSKTDCAPAEEIALTANFYKGDRSLRESGFDITFRFGPFGASTHHFAPVCLNSLLYKTETDLERMSILLGRADQAQDWRAKAAKRQQLIVKYLWDQERGQFFDYDFTTNRRSAYEYATTFYPLWAGLASKSQAQAVVRNLPRFEQPGGIAMSRTESQAQWDFPYGWAPIHLLAVEGMRRYGYTAEADRISGKFLSTVLDNFKRDRNIREKYNVVTRSSETKILEGYAQNFVGFGWTNAVFLELLHESPAAAQQLSRPATQPAAQ